MSNYKIKSRLEDAIYEIETAINGLEETLIDKPSNPADISLSEIIEWLECPFVSDFDKNKVKEFLKLTL